MTSSIFGSVRGNGSLCSHRRDNSIQSFNRDDLPPLEDSANFRDWNRSLAHARVVRSLAIALASLWFAWPVGILIGRSCRGRGCAGASSSTHNRLGCGSSGSPGGRLGRRRLSARGSGGRPGGSPRRLSAGLVAGDCSCRVLYSCERERCVSSKGHRTLCSGHIDEACRPWRPPRV